jgi:hypothetical protein
MITNPLNGLGMKAVDASRCKNLGQLDEGTCQRDINLPKSTIVIVNHLDEPGMRPDKATVCNRLVSLKKCNKMTILLYLEWYQGKSNRIKIAKRAINLPNRLNMHMELLDVVGRVPATRS